MWLTQASFYVERTCLKRRVVDDSWVLQGGDAGPIGALAALRFRGRKPFGTEKPLLFGASAH